MSRARRVLLWVVAAFFVYAIVTSPTKAAGMVHSAGGITADGVSNIGHFFDALLNR